VALGDPPPFDPTAPFDNDAYLARKRARAASGVVPVRGDYPGRAHTLAQVGAGWPIYSSERRYTGTDYAVGGVVIDVIPPYADPDTGEITPTRYRCLDIARPSHPWQYLEAPEVETSALEGVGRQLSTLAAYWLLEQVNRNRLVLALDDVHYLRDAHALGAAIVNL
jgi:hypothetical protein